MIGVDEFNQAFFDKIDEIEMNISNNLDLKSILSSSDIKTINVENFRYSQEKSNIEKKIFESKDIKFDIFEDENNYIVYKINKLEKRSPDLSDIDLKNEIIDLISQRNKFNYNKELFDKINNKNFNDNDFVLMGKNNINSLVLNSVRDNKKFEINSVELLYSLPPKSFTLISDEKNNTYLARILKIMTLDRIEDDKKFKEYISKQNSNTRNNILKSYDLLLNEKYNVVLNQKTIERVKNFFR